MGGDSSENSSKSSRSFGCGRLFRTILGCGCIFLICGLCSIATFSAYLTSEYSVWEDNNARLLKSFEDSDVEIEASLEEKVEEFSAGGAQSQSMDLSCEEVNVLFSEVISDNWGLSHRDVGVLCGDRSIEIYVNSKGVWWVISLWQQAEGNPEFAVVDIKVGPISVGTWSYGYITGEANRGMEEALDVVLDEGFSGRRIEEMTLTEEGVLVVGVLD